MRGLAKGVAGLAAVVAAMSPLFFFPEDEFALATVIATSVMLVVAVASGGYRKLFAPTTRTVVVGFASAAALYLLFWLGNAGITALHPFGISSTAENSIYGLIASSGNPLPVQVAVLAFDSVGFESYFRGSLVRGLGPRIGLGAPFAVAAVDAAIHIASFNPLWVVATFIADSVWGLVYYRTGDLGSSMTSHFVWDVAIFILFPIH